MPHFSLIFSFSFILINLFYLYISFLQTLKLLEKFKSHLRSARVNETTPTDKTTDAPGLPSEDEGDINSRISGQDGGEEEESGRGEQSRDMTW